MTPEETRDYILHQLEINHERILYTMIEYFNANLIWGKRPNIRQSRKNRTLLSKLSKLCHDRRSFLHKWDRLIKDYPDVRPKDGFRFNHHKTLEKLKREEEKNNEQTKNKTLPTCAENDDETSLTK